MRNTYYKAGPFKPRYAILNDTSQNPPLPDSAGRMAEASNAGLIKVEALFTRAYNQTQRKGPLLPRNFVSPRPELCKEKGNLRMGGRSMRRPKAVEEFQKPKPRLSKIEEKIVKKSIPSDTPDEGDELDCPSVVKLFPQETQARKLSNKDVRASDSSQKESVEESKCMSNYAFPRMSPIIPSNLIAAPMSKPFIFQEAQDQLKVKMKALLKIKQCLNYNNFYSLLMSSKVVYNKKLLQEAQVELVAKGLDKIRRKNLWVSKCKIKYNAALYKHYYTTINRHAAEIAKDIWRTFEQQHIFCSNHNNYSKLQHVLHAFAVKHPKIGYVQGLNFVAGNLIVQFTEDVIYKFNS